MTLIELLVVIGILMLLTVVVVPRLQPAAEQRAIREASRSVNTYLCAARNEAVASGRPVGVIFHRDPDQPGVCRKLEQLDLPDSFGGRNEDAVVRVQDWTEAPTTPATFYWSITPMHNWDYRYGTVVLKVQVRYDQFAGRITDFENGTIRYGDQIQLGGKGPWYTIVRDDIVGGNMLGSPLSAVNYDFPPDANGYLQFYGGGGDAPADAKDLNGNANPDGWVDNYWLTLVLDPGSIARVPYPKCPCPIATSSSTLPRHPFSRPLSFRIQPQPYVDTSGGFSFAALASAADVLELPNQAAIDLNFSGFDTPSRTFLPRDDNANLSDGRQDKTPIVVMFSPTGGVMGVYTHAAPTASAPFPKFEFIRNPEIVHFLIGRLDRATDDDMNGEPDGGEERRMNVEDSNHYWVSLNPQSGNVVTTQVSASTSTPYQNLTDDEKKTYLRESREGARESRSMGGR